MRIYIDTIPHQDHRYPTVGDYWFPHSPHEELEIIVRISEMENLDYEFLVGIHEQVEAYLTWKRGIPEASITAFDVEYEGSRKEGNTSEPGDDPTAPYFREHQFATVIERAIAQELGVDWEKYEEVIDSL